MYDLLIFAASYPGVITVFAGIMFAHGYLTAEHRHS
jgi:hypothetical protein